MRGERGRGRGERGERARGETEREENHKDVNLSNELSLELGAQNVL
jgi:hypothetical protein